MNTTVNVSSCSSLQNPTVTKIGVTIAYCLIFVVSLVGNSFIALIVYKTRSLRKPINYFITNMAMSDLLFPMFLFPWKLTELYVNSWLSISGPFGETFCKLSYFLPDVSTLVSVQSMILIAVDRFGAVVFPLRSPVINPKLCPFFIVATWIIAMAVLSPYLFAFRLVEYHGLLVCQPQWKEVFGESFSNANYFLSLNVTCFFHIPTALLIILYSIIFIKLKTQVHPGEQSINAEEQRARRNRNVLKMAVAIVIGFVLCFLPWSIYNLLSFFAPDRLTHCVIFLYVHIAWFVAVSNCAINPCICFIFCSNYHQGLKRLFKCFG